MGILLTRIRLGTKVAVDSMVSELAARTGVRWQGSEEVLPDGTNQMVLVVPSLQWEVVLAWNGQLDGYQVEAVPAHWLSINYAFWQVVASLVKRGGVHVSPIGKKTAVRLPKWSNAKWSELSWWARLGG